MPKRDRKMGINVWTSMGFKNRSFQGGAMKNSSHDSDAEPEKTSETSSEKNYQTTDNIWEDSNTYFYVNQVVLSNTLSETLKYIQTHAYDKRKRYVLGELWDSLGDYDNEDDYKGELIDFEPDSSIKNIFVA